MTGTYGCEVNMELEEQTARPWELPGGTFVLWLLMLSILLGSLLFFSATRTIELRSQELHSSQKEEAEPLEGELTPMILRESGMDKQLVLSLPTDMTAEQIVIENHYWEKKLYIRLTSNRPGQTLPEVSGDIRHIEGAWRRAKDEELMLTFVFDDYYETHTTYNMGYLSIEFNKASEEYPLVVVAKVPEADDRLTNVLAYLETEECQKQVGLEGVKVYTLSDSSVIAADFLKSVNADLFLELELREDESQEYGIGAQYNEDYYLPKCDNAYIAQTFMEQVTIATSNRTLGLMPVTMQGDGIELESREISDIPGTRISLGNVANEKENALLGNMEYQQKIAVGILQGIGIVKDKLARW